MKKLLNYLLIVAMCIISNNLDAQDLITKKDGSDISAKVLEITITEIKYNQFDNLSGPIFTILKSDVLMIRYENGTKDIFNETVSSDNVLTENEYKYVKKNPPVSSRFNDMVVGEEIIIKEFTKGLRKGVVYYYQNDRQLKYKSMFKTLKTIDVCDENMELANKRRNVRIPLSVIAIVTFPAGTLILIIPITIIQKKELKHLKMAIEDYNLSLK